MKLMRKLIGSIRSGILGPFVLAEDEEGKFTKMENQLFKSIEIKITGTLSSSVYVIYKLNVCRLAIILFHKLLTTTAATDEYLIDSSHFVDVILTPCNGQN